MSRRNHEYEGSAGTNTSRLNEPPTSLSKITKNVDDYLDKPDSKKMSSPDKSSKSSSSTTIASPPPPPPPTTTSTSTTTKAPPPPPPTTTSTSTTTKAPPPPPPTPSAPKAQYLDQTDPNETGRNVADIIFGLEDEGEDEIYAKFTRKSTASTSSDNTDNDNNKPTKPGTDDEKKSENNP
jgi:hypothetical protein